MAPRLSDSCTQKRATNATSSSRNATSAAQMPRERCRLPPHKKKNSHCQKLLRHWKNAFRLARIPCDTFTHLPSQPLLYPILEGEKAPTPQQCGVWCVACGGVVAWWRGGVVAWWCGGVAWRGVAWRGVAWRGVAWRGVVWCGVVWCGVVWCVVVCCGVVWCVVVWYGVVWCGV